MRMNKSESFEAILTSNSLKITMTFIVIVKVSEILLKLHLKLEIVANWHS